MPAAFISSRNCLTVRTLFTASRLRIRPAPCGADSFHSAFPRPTPRRMPSRMLMGIATGSPAFAEIAPFLRIGTVPEQTT